MRNERRFNKFLKERFLRNIDGFSLAEIMVAAGILGMISLGVMQMTQNLQKNQKKFQYDAEINDFIMKLQMGLRDKAACERTFAGGSDPANSPPVVTPANPLQPATVHANAITPDYATSTALINNVYSGNVDGAGNALILAQVGQQYGAVGGTFTVQEIKLFDTVAPAAMNELVRARVAMRLRKLGSVDDQGDADPGNDILKGAWGRAEVVKTFEIMVSVWDAADPNIGGNTPGTIRSCYVQEDFYVQGACNAIGGQLDNDGACKNIVLGKIGETYQDPMLDNESQNFEVLVDGDTRVKNAIEVGYDNGDATPGGDKLNPVNIGRWDNSADASRPGSAVVQNYLFLGFDSNEAAGVPDVPVPSKDENESTGSIVAGGNVWLYGAPNQVMPILRNNEVGSIINSGSIYTGFTTGDDMQPLAGPAGGDGGVGIPGEIVAAQGLTVRNKGNTGYGVNIVTDGAGPNKFLLRIGDNAGFTDAGGDQTSPEANTLRLAGIDAGGNAAGEVHLRLGGNDENHQITGKNGRIGINEEDPQVQFDVNGDARIDGNLVVDDGGGVVHNDYDLTVNGNAEVNGYLKLTYPGNNDLAHNGSESFDRMAATVGWVRNRIAATLAPDDATRQQIAADVLNVAFQEEESALRVIQRNYCQNLDIRSNNGSTTFNFTTKGQWVGSGATGRCRYDVSTCGNGTATAAYCNNVYANTSIRSYGWIRAATNIYTQNGYIRAYGANGYVRAEQYVYAGTYIRGLSYLWVDDYARASRFCIGGSNAKANCLTTIPTSYCGAFQKLRGLPNGYSFCAWDIRP